MSATHRMKRLLISLVPWMAMTAAAGQDVPRQAEVIYTNVGPAPAWRMGDECYIAPSVLTSWHWPYSMVGAEATIEAEGRTVKVPTRVVHSRVLVPVAALFNQLGGSEIWRNNGDQMQILGQVRMIAVKDGSLQIDSTLSSKPHIFTLSNPGRLVVDMRGMTLSQAATRDLPENVHASQYDSDLVRIVYESPSVPRMPTNTEDPSRHFEVKVDYPPHTKGTTTSPDLIHGADQSSQNPASQSAVSGSQAPAANDTVALISESQHSLALQINLTRPLSGPVRMQRTDPFALDLILPGASLAESQSLASATIKAITATSMSDGALLHIEFARPMGVELSTSAASVSLTFLKPTVGNGKLAGKTIVVDAGHGGGDTGARSPDHSVLEKDLTLAIATDLAEQLAAQGANVLMTRKDDTFIPLKERAAIANRNNADLFVSVHINSNAVSESHSGSITFYHASNPICQLLAECVEHEVGRVSGIPAIGAWSDTRIYSSGFSVLRNSTMPGILVETGFINNSIDRELMCSPGFQNMFAKAIVRGIRVFLGDAKEEAN